MTKLIGGFPVFIFTDEKRIFYLKKTFAFSCFQKKSGEKTFGFHRINFTKDIKKSDPKKVKVSAREGISQ